MEQEKIVAFLEENIKTIYAYALARVSRKEEAEDLAGDIMLAIMQDADHRNSLGQQTQKKFSKINDAPKYKQAIFDCYRS